ncbi:hypothetical protein [Candidatus Similichlamydia epinepheli]|uniref:hypothetical protein n=1 Tax=Candidatus Similichlamydia epinepheli TaxID=1903953 RepID=UPI000D38F727|nr:hypothetical protein [Candidatus Similichlamydia epinepheli]
MTRKRKKDRIKNRCLFHPSDRSFVVLQKKIMFLLPFLGALFVPQQEIAAINKTLPKIVIKGLQDRNLEQELYAQVQHDRKICFEIAKQREEFQRHILKKKMDG